MSREEGSRPADASGRGRRRIRTSLKVLVPTVAALGAGAAIAVGQIGGSDATITGCVLTNSDSDTPVGSLRVLDPTVTGDQSCTDGQEAQITWNQQGPTGPTGTGVAGPTGPQGPQGPQGPAGPAGSAQVSSGASTDILMYLAPASDLGKLNPTPVGETTNPTNANATKAFDLTSFTLDAMNSASIGSATSGAGAGKVSFQGFQFVKPLDKYSAQLFQDLASGSHLASVEIVIRKPGANGMDAPVVQYLLKTVFLTNIHISGEAKNATETIQGKFGAIQFVLYGQTNSGQSTVSSAGGWSQVTNSPVTVPGIGTIRDTRNGRKRK